MALSGVHVSCRYVGIAGKRGRVVDLPSKPIWSETMASAGTTTNTAAQQGGQEIGDVVLRVHASLDVWVAIGSAPNASTGPREFVEANSTYDLACDPGDKLAWIAA
ncbi:hypothetical protein GFL54_19025 [Rhizobium laguerreae]|uniref:hypothetical protein n=1 Tax=Rhizobium laguerreae TaxID=1076926 RepID=UPI00143F685F|nr:hypothetical protein [Rhizobium laguerreae]NKM86356.1 hypothetical protein [Rhizobium laguerreae]